MTPISIDSRSIPSRRALWAGRPAAVEGTVRPGYPESAILGIGIVELVHLVLYLVPRTAILGAVLCTGYLGGAIATHVRVGSPILSHVLFPIYVAAFLWVGLVLRDRRVRQLIHS